MCDNLGVQRHKLSKQQSNVGGGGGEKREGEEGCETYKLFLSDTKSINTEHLPQDGAMIPAD